MGPLDGRGAFTENKRHSYLKIKTRHFPPHTHLPNPPLHPPNPLHLHLPPITLKHKAKWKAGLRVCPYLRRHNVKWRGEEKAITAPRNNAWTEAGWAVEGGRRVRARCRLERRHRRHRRHRCSTPFSQSRAAWCYQPFHQPLNASPCSAVRTLSR